MLFINCNIVTGCCSRVEEKRKSGGSKVKVEYRVLHWTYLFSVVVGLISSLDLLHAVVDPDGRTEARRSSTSHCQDHCPSDKPGAEAEAVHITESFP